jgi:hypothetical protein
MGGGELGVEVVGAARRMAEQDGQVLALIEPCDLGLVGDSLSTASCWLDKRYGAVL